MYPARYFSCSLLKTVLNRPNLSSADQLFTDLYSAAYRIAHFNAKVFEDPQPAFCIAFAIKFHSNFPGWLFLTSEIIKKYRRIK